MRRLNRIIARMMAGKQIEKDKAMDVLIQLADDARSWADDDGRLADIDVGDIEDALDWVISLIQEAEEEAGNEAYWIEGDGTYPGPGRSNYACSECGESAGTWIEHISADRTWPYCPNCGAPMSREKVKYAD